MRLHHADVFPGKRSRTSAPTSTSASTLAVIPERFPGIEGLKPLGDPDDLVPEILDESLIDRRVDVTLDDAVATCAQLAKQGLFVGPSSGAYVLAAWELARRGEHRTIVTLLNDTGERYGSTGMWVRRLPCVARSNGPGTMLKKGLKPAVVSSRAICWRPELPPAPPCTLM